jgi:RNA polymerase sigma-70 factor (ECF subfamily)
LTGSRGVEQPEDTHQPGVMVGTQSSAATGALRLVQPDPDPAPLSVDDAALVLQSQGGDRAAFEQLVRRTARLLFSRLYLETGDAHKAEDLVQETFLIAWRSIGQVTEPAGFRTWLFSVAHSALVDATRREGRKKRAGTKSATGTDALEALADTAPAPPEAAASREQRERVLRVLRSMPDEYRLPLTLRYLGGADYDTIGRQLGLTNGSLRGLLNRGMAKLRERMKGW